MKIKMSRDALASLLTFKRPRVPSLAKWGPASVIALGFAVFVVWVLQALVMPAQAQAALTLVSNTRKSNDGEQYVHTAFSYAQEFNTGGTAATLRSITLADVRKVEAGESLVVSLYSDAGGLPGTRLHTLTAPASLSNGNATFTVPAGTTVSLAPNTSYFIKIAIGTGSVSISRTVSPREDRKWSQSGWRIANRFYLSIDSGAFEEIPEDRSVRFSLRGTIGNLANIPATGKPTITGVVQVGQTLVAGTDAIDDDDGKSRAVRGDSGLAFTYQWVRVDGNNETRIPGATSSTYTLVAADADKKLKVRVTFFDDRGNAEGPLESEETATVESVTPTYTVRFGGSSYTATEGGNGATVRVEISPAPTAAFIIPLAKTHLGGATASDYSGVPASVIFAIGDTSKTFTVNATDDSVDDNGESVRLSFGTLPSEVSAGSVSESTVTLTDNDTSGLTVSPSSLTITEGHSDSYTIRLRSQPSGSVTVTIVDPADNTDVTVNPSSLTFSTTNWHIAQTATVSAADDLDAQDESATVTHTVSGYGSATGEASVSVTVIDDDPEPSAVPEQVTDITWEPLDTRIDPVDGEVSEIRLNWTAPNDGGSSITGYRVRAQVASEELEEEISVGGQTLTATFDAVGYGRTWVVNVWAANKHGEGGASEDLSVEWTREPGAPSIDVSPGSGRLKVSWDEPDTGGRPIDAYLVRWMESGVDISADTPAEVEGSTRVYVVSSLTNGTEYEVSVAARSSVGLGSWSPAVKGTPVAEADAPSLTSITSADQSLIVRWEAPGDNATVENYIVQWVTGNAEFTTSDVQEVAVPASQLEYTIESLENGTEYSVRVVAANGGGRGGASNVLTGTPSDLPGAPTAVALTAGNEEIAVSWDAPDSAGHSSITAYTVEWRSNDTGFDASRSAETEGDTLTLTITGLTNGVEYDVRVIAENAAGKGEPSEVVSGTPTGAGELALTGITISDVETDGATLTVTIADQDASNSPTVYLRYRVSPSGEWSETQQQTAEDDRVEFTLSGLSASTGYDVQAALDGRFPEDGLVSTTFTTVSGDFDVPVITEVAAVDSELTFAWAAPTDAESEITGYDLRYIETDAEDKSDDNWTVLLDVLGSGTEASDECVTDFGALTESVTADGEWTDDCASTNRDGSHARFYTFTLDEETEVQIDLTSDRDTYLLLLSDTGREGDVVEENDDLDYAGGDLNSRILNTLDAGSYTVEATTYNASVTGEYLLKIDLTEDEPGVDSPDTQTTPNDDGEEPEDDASFMYTLSGLTNGTDYDLQVRAVYGEEQGEWSTTASGSPVEVAQGDSIGCVTDLGNLTDDIQKEGEWSEDCASVNREGSYARFYSFTLEQETEVRIGLTSDMDTYLFLLRDSGLEGDVVSENDDVDSVNRDYDSQITAALTAGTYTVEATTYAEATAGEFNLRIALQAVSEMPTPTPPSTPDDCVTDLGTITYDVSERGEWTEDCESANRDGGFARYYTFTLGELIDVRIDLISDEDTYLFLLRGEEMEREIVSENDDVDSDSRNFDSRIDATLSAGTYTVEATTYSSGVTGEFTLGISQ